MAVTTLAVIREDQTTEYTVDPHGTVIGRSPSCHVVLDSPRVSRQHARLFQDPFGRWIIHDLNSSHGVIVGGQRVRSHALLPGQKMMIGPFTLALRQPPPQDIEPDPAMSGSTMLMQSDADMRVVRTSSGQNEVLPADRLKELNRITARLEELTSPSELYPEACRCLATGPKTAALVLRLPASGATISSPPQVVACCLGSQQTTDAAPDLSNLCLSRRVIEAARGCSDVVMARSIAGEGNDLSLTLIDTSNPRAVLCAAVGEGNGTVDLLYLDVPLKRSDAGFFDLVQAVARQIRMTGKYLLSLEAKAQRSVLDYQLTLARQIQDKLTPASVPEVAGVDLAFYYEPALWVGGDYCDVWLLPDGRLAFVVGDVAGKGLPAAMVMANLQAALRTAALFCRGAAQAMDHVNRHLRQHMPAGTFVTLFLGFLDASSGTLEYVNAGHILPLMVVPHAGVSALGSPRNIVLGISEDPFVGEMIQMTPGSALLAVTDGITESVSPDGKLMGIEPIERLLMTTEIRSAKQLVDLTTQAGARFRGARSQQDDVTVLGLMWRGVDDAPQLQMTHVAKCRSADEPQMSSI